MVKAEEYGCHARIYEHRFVVASVRCLSVDLQGRGFHDTPPKTAKTEALNPKTRFPSNPLVIRVPFSE